MLRAPRPARRRAWRRAGWGPRLGWLVVACGCDVFPDGLFSGSPDARPRPTADAGAEALPALEAHDAVRAAAQPAPVPPLEPTYWDEGAAAFAREWAAGCRFAHSGAPGLGENLYASTLLTEGIGDAVAAWASEAVDYAYAANACAAGKICGHYTQLVWRESTGIGCASQVCETGSPFEGRTRWLLWVCEYVPPGNLVGARPY